MTQETRKKVPFGQPIFPEKRLSPEQLAKRKAEDAAFAQRCRAIFKRVYPELVKEHYGWAIMIEPDSGDYFIDSDPEVAFQNAKEKHPTAVIMEMRLLPIKKTINHRWLIVLSKLNKSITDKQFSKP